MMLKTAAFVSGISASSRTGLEAAGRRAQVHPKRRTRRCGRWCSRRRLGARGLARVRQEVPPSLEGCLGRCSHSLRSSQACRSGHATISRWSWPTNLVAWDVAVTPWLEHITTLIQACGMQFDLSMGLTRIIQVTCITGQELQS